MRITAWCSISYQEEPVYRIKPVRRIGRSTTPVKIDNDFSKDGKKTFLEVLMEALEEEEKNNQMRL